MTWLVRNYQFQKERRIDLGEFGVITFKAKQQLGLIHDKNLAKVLAAVSGIHVVRRVEDPNTTIPDLKVVNTRVPVTVVKPIEIVKPENGIPYVEPQKSGTILPPGAVVEIPKEPTDVFVPEAPEEEVKKDDTGLLPFCGCGKCGKRVTHKGNKFLRGHHLVKSKNQTKEGDK